jgi:hypothetical protein
MIMIWDAQLCRLTDMEPRAEVNSITFTLDRGSLNKSICFVLSSWLMLDRNATTLMPSIVRRVWQCLRVERVRGV